MNGTQRYHRSYREENQELEDDILMKVRTMKTVCIDLGYEIKNQNYLLDNMDNDFEKTQGYLGRTMHNLQVKLIRGKGYFGWLLGDGYMWLWFKLIFVCDGCIVCDVPYRQV